MLELREELVALIEWEKAAFPRVTRVEIDAEEHRILRKAELFCLIREIAERN
jgi:hypothetical protein